MRNEEQMLYTEKSVAYRLGVLKQQFDEISWKRHIIIMDNGYTLGLKRGTKVNCTNVVSGGEKMTLVSRISGVSAKMESVMIIFPNNCSSYPIKGVPDLYEKVFYRSYLSGWMSNQMFVTQLREPRAVTRHRVTSMDNCPVHNETEAVPQASNSMNNKIPKLPANSMKLCQPLDSFVIQKFEQ